MAHDNYLMLISLDLDGMLTDRERDDLRQHVSTCAACANTWEHMRLTDSLLKVQPELSPPPDFRARLAGRVRAYETQRRWRPWVLTALIGMALAVLGSTVLPLMAVVFQWYEPLLGWPVVGTALEWVERGLSLAVGLVRLGVHDLLRWLGYLTTDPVAMAVVIGGLAVACIWIGLLEVTKGDSLVEMSHQQA